MTIEEAIAYFESRRNYNPHDGDPEAERLALAALRAQQELESKPLNGWISVKDRLPEMNHAVLGWYKDNPFSGYTYGVVSWNGKGWVFVYAQRYVTNVTHWQPMPEPPETEKTEE